MEIVGWGTFLQFGERVRAVKKREQLHYILGRGASLIDRHLPPMLTSACTAAPLAVTPLPNFYKRVEP